MQPIRTAQEAISRLEHLFHTSGMKDEALLAYIEQLASENNKLKLSLHKLRASQSSKAHTTSSMHSKLTDALRE
ncbi:MULTISPECIES: hypothetical protein [Paenibacillus]|uniref:hypothetical protein n=1 Tax=Paenibacillus TaxID=44249 RepID=UPI00203E7ED1|nr:hypothetical protein [Paenibacillus camelliae]MCM3632305.1 hypothetical protein [Paenibacillus camelliae]